MTDLRYNIQIEVVTPLSVGAGIQNDWVKGVDFVQKNNKLYVLDLNKMMSCGLEIEKISQCFINQGWHLPTVRQPHRGDFQICV